jgi:hypothetical protein
VFSWSRGSNVLALLFSGYSERVRELTLTYLCFLNSGIIVTQTEELFPDFDFWSALNNADPAVIEKTYLHVRPQAIAAVVSAGGSSADGSVFYRVAFIHSARLAQADRIPADISFHDYVVVLSTLHYRDWRMERHLEAPAQEFSEHAPAIDMPASDELRDLRWSVWARRQFFRMNRDERNQIQELADDAALEPEARRFSTEEDAVAGGYGTSLQHYKYLLPEQTAAWTGVLPAWVLTALTDPHFIKIWDQTQLFEQKRSGAAEQSPQTSHFWRNAFVVLGIATLIALAFQFFFQSQSETPGEVYSDNFSAPESLLADLASRQALSPDKDSLGLRPADCDQAFAEADAAYQDKDYREAAAALAQLLDDSHKACQSDAYFYLAIVGLQLNEPELTIECLSNIEDLDRYGEDIYWYQALAFVKLAEQNPLMKEKAVRAMDRVISNTEIPERREQAQKMLEQLND